MSKLSIFYFIVSFIFFSGFSYSQTYEWAKKMGGSDFDVGYSIAVDPSGNVYTLGTFNNSADFDPGAGTTTLTSLGASDIFITKVDPNGNFLWARQLGGTGNDIGLSITLDINNNVITTGSFEGTIDFNPGAGTFPLSSAGMVDIFISKLNANGDFVWAKKIGGISNDEGFSVVSDASNNLFLTGNFSDVVDFDPGIGTSNLNSLGQYDAFVLKLNSAGNLIWAKKMGGMQTNNGASISIDPNGNVITSGSFSGIVDFNPGVAEFNLDAGVGLSSYISKLDPNGNFLWAKSIIGANFCEGYAVAAGNSGNVFMSGYFEGASDFDPGSGVFTMTATSTRFAYILKLNGSGDFLWAKNFSGTGGSGTFGGIDLDVNENVYTCGYFSKTIDFDPGSGVSNLVASGNTNPDGYLSKLDPNGNFLWARKIGGNGRDEFKGLILGSSDVLYSTGYFSNTVDFDPGSGVSNLQSSGNSDVFILKLSPCVVPNAGNITGASSLCSGISGSYSASTVTGASSFVWSVPSGFTISSGQGTNTLQVQAGGSSGSISLLAGNACGTIPLILYPVSVLPLPIVSATASPSSSICAGSQITLNGLGASNYSWTGGILNGQAFIPGSSTSYTVTGTDAAGCTNTFVQAITVNSYPGITTQPGNQNAEIGGIAQFTITTDQPLATYQWEQNAGLGFNTLFNAGPYSGVTSSSLLVSNVLLAQNNYIFRCKVKFETCETVSNTAALNVLVSSIMESQSKVNFSLNPNPTTKHLLIKGRFSLNSKFHIFNMNGMKQEVLIIDCLEDEALLDVSILPKGLYFISVFERSLRFVKE